MVTSRRRFPTPPAFRDNAWDPPRIQDFSRDLGPGGSSSSLRAGSVGADGIGHMQPPNRKNLEGVSDWTKSQADGGLPEGQKPPRNKGKGWRSMSIRGPE